MEVLGHVEDCHDANYGVTWEHLYQSIEYCFRNEINEMKKKQWDSFCSHMYTEYLTEKRREQETDIKTLEKYVEDNKEWLEAKYESN